MTSFFNGVISVINVLLAPIFRIDLRAWFTIFLGLLVWRIIEIVAANPDLTDNASFMQLITPICGAGGLLLVATFLFGSNKESAQKSEALKDNARTMRDAGIPVGGDGPDPKKPVPVVVKNPYDDKTDDELRQLLIDRSEDPSNRTRDEMLAKLAELDKHIPTEPRA